MKQEQIFSKDFLNLDYKAVTKELNEKGYFSFDNALTDNFVNQIKNDVDSAGLSLNNNNVGGVYYTHGNQFFFSHLLAVSKSFFNYCTSDKLLDICSDYFKEKYRLKCLRYYENLGGQNMQWHTDNRNYTGKETSGTNIKNEGIIMLAYIADVKDGEFQYLKGSHNWSSENKFNDYNHDYISKNHSSDIVGFKKPKGSIIIYNTRGVHRAKPTNDKNFVRKSILLRIDADTEHSEPILLKTEYVDKMDDRIKEYLGFGKKTGIDMYPVSSLETLPINKKIFSEISKWLIGRLANKLPGFLRKRVRNAIGYRKAH